MYGEVEFSLVFNASVIYACMHVHGIDVNLLATEGRGKKH
jgi:hypothetical protein